jgi:hypothetical protein
MACLLALSWTLAQEDYDYAEAMRQVAARFSGRPGVVLHLGDSITYSNAYSAWARGGRGKTAEDEAVLRWMHTGRRDDSDGWWLCSVDRPGNRSETAASGVRSDEFLAGGKGGLPPLRKILDTYRPQAAVVMLGTNDASAGRDVAAYRADMERIVRLILERHAVPILSTIPPHPHRGDLARRYNEALRELARTHRLPLIDYEREILRRRPNDWNGTLLGKDDVHPTAGSGDVTPSSEPTEENLRRSGYLLRGWLSVRKIAEVKSRVFDRLEKR